MSDDVTKMLRILMNGQSSIHEELKKIRNEIVDVENRLSKKIGDIDRKLTKRIDKIGKQLAYLEDDAPTRVEFDNLVTRVNKLQNRLAIT